MSSLPTVLITGATGKQGGATIDALLTQRKVNIRVLTRNPDSESAKALQTKGFEVFKGSFEDKSSLVKALTGVESAFLVTDPLGKEGAKGEEKAGKAFIDAAKETGVKHVVFTSVGDANAKTGVPHFEAKFQIEEYLRSSGISNTVLRPVGFYENFSHRSSIETFMAFGLFEAALQGRKIKLVSIRDIGYFGARALENPAEYDGRIIDLAGDDLSISEIQDAYAKAQGFRPWRAYLPSFIIGLLPYDFKQFMRWIHSTGYSADIATLRKEHKDLLTFEQWLA